MESMEATRPSMKRAQYLVNRRFQYLTVAVVFMLALLIMAGVGAILLMDDFLPALGLDEVTRGSLGFIVQLNAVLVIILGLTLTLRLTHLIAGPIFKFQAVLKSVQEGDYDLPPIHLRRGDAFGELAEELSMTVLALRTRRDQARAAGERTRESLEKVRQVLEAGEGSAHREEALKALEGAEKNMDEWLALCPKGKVDEVDAALRS